MPRLTGMDILKGMPAGPARAAVGKAKAALAAKKPAATKIKPPITSATRVTVVKAAGGYVVTGQNDGPNFESHEAVATTREQRDSLISGMLGEGD